MDDRLARKLKNYSTPETVKHLINATNVVFLVGVTAAGKDTILKKLLALPDYHHIISHTTRSPRKNHGVLETNGVDYHFIDFKTAEQMLDNGGYVEAKAFSGNIYGTSVAEIQMAHDEGKIAITDIEVQGVTEYCALAHTVTPVFLLPPDFQTWQHRLHSRHAEVKMDEAEVLKRLQTAESELREALTKPYFEYVINRDLEESVKITNDIAHGRKSSRKNKEARQIAEQLLIDLEEHLNSL